LQSDKLNCAWFTLFMGYKMTNYSDYFQYLSLARHVFDKKEYSPGIFYYSVGFRFLPARLLASMQSQDMFNELLLGYPSIRDEVYSKRLPLSDVDHRFSSLLSPTGKVMVTNPIILTYKAKQLHGIEIMMRQQEPKDTTIEIPGKFNWYLICLRASKKSLGVTSTPSAAVKQYHFVEEAPVRYFDCLGLL
jgi:hypothetical protein